MELRIPDYQRPYAWSEKNINDLMDDLESVMDSIGEKGVEAPDYRVGGIILHQEMVEGKTVFNLVDGQQRVVSFLLLARALGEKMDEYPLYEALAFESRVSQANVWTNYGVIRDRVSGIDRDALRRALEKTELVVFVVKRLQEAFQLFDSQNSRGRGLDPHDLLKAYHLREMRDYLQSEKEATVERWEAVKPDVIRDLFTDLYRIHQWRLGQSAERFSSDRIDVYKGISVKEEYSYAKRAFKASPFFQIGEPFISGQDFFRMVDRYLVLRRSLGRLPDEVPAFKKINGILENLNLNRYVGFRYAKNLFFCVLLCYYDRFRNLDVNAVRKMFIWAMSLRGERARLGFASVNKYVSNPEGSKNRVNLFQRIVLARRHTEIASLQVSIPDKWLWKSGDKDLLLDDLKAVMGGNYEESAG